MLLTYDYCTCAGFQFLDEEKHTDGCAVIRLAPYKELFHTVLDAGGFIAGGIVRSVLDGSAINDIDIFGRDIEHLQLIIDDVLDYLGADAVTTNNEKCITIMHPGYPKIQLIKTRYAYNLEGLLKQFPFTVCCLGIEYNSCGVLCIRALDSAYHDVEERKLEYVTTTDNEAVGTLYRFGYYQSLGYKPSLRCLTQVVNAVRIPTEELIDKGLQSLHGRLEGSY